MTKLKKHEDRLMAILGFDEDDLAANRAGRISLKQIARLKRKRQGFMPTPKTIVGLGAVLVAILWGTIGVTRLSYETLSTLTMTMMLFVVIALKMMEHFDGITADVRKETVEEVEGRVELSMQTTLNADRYFLNVDQMRFKVTQQALLAFKNGDPYRIYYAPRSKQVLSVEWLREDDNLIHAEN
jgi:hypothetical protein